MSKTQEPTAGQHNEPKNPTEASRHVVQTFTNLWREQMERVMSAQMRALDASFSESERMVSEAQRLTEVQMEAGRAMAKSMMEQARKVSVI